MHLPCWKRRVLMLLTLGLLESRFRTRESMNDACASAHA